MLSQGTQVRVTKVDAIREVTPYNDQDADPGAPYQQHGVSNGYEVRGEVSYDVEVGEPLILLRRERNGINVQGFFNTSAVKEVKQVKTNLYFVSTRNSIYRVEVEEQDDTTQS